MKNFLLLFLFFLTMCMLIFPQHSFTAAGGAITLWWQVLLPSLLPFFIIAELLISLGAIKKLGRMLEPLMEPLFNLPGAASLAVIMGFTAGFPIGAAVTASLRQNGEITRSEGNRLLAFTNNASPLFIIVSVAAGMLHTPQVGLLLALMHYGINLLTGILLGLASKRKRQKNSPGHQPESVICEPFGTLLKKSSQKAFGNITLIGCYMVFFSVFIKMMEVTGANRFFSAAIGKTLSLFKLSPELAEPFVSGIWEMTLGLAQAAACDAPLTQVFSACCLLMAWGGVSILAQVAAMISPTDLSIKTYLACSFFKAGVSFALALFLAQKWLILPSSTKAAIELSPIAAITIPLCISFALFLLFLPLAQAIKKLRIKRGSFSHPRDPF